MISTGPDAIQFRPLRASNKTRKAYSTSTSTSTISYTIAKGRNQ